MKKQVGGWTRFDTIWIKSRYLDHFPPFLARRFQQTVKNNHKKGPRSGLTNIKQSWSVSAVVVSKLLRVMLQKTKEPPWIYKESCHRNRNQKSSRPSNERELGVTLKLYPQWEGNRCGIQTFCYPKNCWDKKPFKWQKWFEDSKKNGSLKM